MKTRLQISLSPLKQRLIYSGIMFSALTLFGFAWWQMKLDLNGSCANILKAGTFILRMAAIDATDWPDVTAAAGESLAVSVLATIVSGLAAFLVSFGAAGNVAPRFLAWLCKSLAAGIRAVPTLIWTLIFVAYLGLGPFAGVMGLFFHSFAYLVKAFSQSIEEVESGVLEALRATGASWLQIMARGVFPSIQTGLISWIALRFEFNVAMSTVLGLVGAGGIGHELALVMRTYAFEKAGFVVLVIFGMSFGIEMFFHKLKINVDA